nr:hypothetical protein [Nocardia ninae]
MTAQKHALLLHQGDRVRDGGRADLKLLGQFGCGVRLPVSEVWFSPFPCELSAAQLLPYFADCADRADAVGAEVFVADCELSLFGAGFLPGADTLARIETFNSGDLAALASMADANARINATLADVTTIVRKRFRGRLTYAAGTWEDINWGPSTSSVPMPPAIPVTPYRQGLAVLHAQGKPIAVTEGLLHLPRCRRTRRNGLGHHRLRRRPTTRQRRLHPRRRRTGPLHARTLRLLRGGVGRHRVLAHLRQHQPPHHRDPHFDTDLASFGVCKVMPDHTLAPKRLPIFVIDAHHWVDTLMRRLVSDGAISRQLTPPSRSLCRRQPGLR